MPPAMAARVVIMMRAIMYGDVLAVSMVEEEAIVRVLSGDEGF